MACFLVHIVASANVNFRRSPKQQQQKKTLYFPFLFLFVRGLFQSIYLYITSVRTGKQLLLVHFFRALNPSKVKT